MYEAVTGNICVKVEPTYLDEQSAPVENHYVWAYRVVIENRGTATVQLRSRYWKITDGYGLTQEVQGEGVVGEQPVLRPGERFEYTSGTPLNTPGGIMVGKYTMAGQDGKAFTVDIPAFSLDSPYQPAAIN